MVLINLPMPKTKDSFNEKKSLASKLAKTSNLPPIVVLLIK
jgi:hypothetical protein